MGRIEAGRLSAQPALQLKNQDPIALHPGVRRRSIRRALLLASTALLFPGAAQAASFTVTDPGDTGAAGQFRTQIGAANANPGADSILFNVSPVITSSVTISDSTTLGGSGPAASVSGTGAVILNSTGTLAATVSSNVTMTNLGIAQHYLGSGPPNPQRDVNAVLSINNGGWTVDINGTLASPNACSNASGVPTGCIGGNIVLVTAPNATINVNAGGNVNGGANSNGIFVMDPPATNQVPHNSYTLPVNINISGGQVSGLEAIVMSGGGSLTMTGGTVTGTGPGQAAIVAWNAPVSITGGTVTSAGLGVSLHGGSLLIGQGATLTTSGAAITTAIESTNTVTTGPFLTVTSFDGTPSTVTIGGTVTSLSGLAVGFDGSGDTLILQPTAVITGVAGASSFADSNLKLGGTTGTGTFDVSQVGPAGQYQGFVTFTKIEGSTWTLTGTPNAVMPWTVNGGTLAVNGSMGNSPFTVNSGGTLGGNGTVGVTQVNAGGTLAPGNSIGLLTVQGSLTLAAASSYLVEVSPANADRTNVIGTASIGGATMNANFAAGAYVNKQYTIMNATGGVTGTFNGPVNTNLPSGFVSSLSYDPNNVYLNLALFNGPTFTTGLNVNQQNVATSLTNFFNRTGGIPIVFGALSPAGLTQISGELATRTQQTTFDAMDLFLGLLTDPFVAGRGDGISAGGGAAQFADESYGVSAYASKDRPRSRSERDAYAAIWRKAPPMADTFTQRWSVWAAGYGGSQTTDGNAVLGSNTATSRVYGTAVGADYRFSPNTLAGFAMAGGGTNFSLVNGLGSGRSDLFQAGAFLRHNFGPAYISAALAYGWQDITTDRTVTVAGVDQLRAKFNANTWSGRLEGGYRFVTQGFGLTPYAAGQFISVELPNYAEAVVAGANTFALAYAAKEVTASRSELGLRADKSFAMQDGVFTLRGRAAWAHNFNTDRNIMPTLQTLPGASFIVNGATQARDAALTTASAEMKWLNGFSVAGTFEGEFSDVTKSYAGKGVVRYAW
jgi:uncharacterized protein with beta-barrel porin domain